MSLYATLTFAFAMLLLAMTPGPGAFATVSKALSSGFRQTLPLIAGIVLGDLLFLLFAIYGLAMIAESFSTLFALVKYLGGAYLLWLGISLWRDCPRHASPAAASPSSAGYSFASGLSITLSNPKVMLFYLGFLPAFIDLETLSGVDTVVIATVVSLVLGSVMLLYAYAASRATLLLHDKSAQDIVHKAAGSIMIAAGALLLFKT